jgi:hypothetical protein
MTVWHDRASIGLRNAHGRTTFKKQRKGLAFHWEGVSTKQAGLESSFETLRNIQRAHLANKKEGYIDIAYNFAVDYLGNVFELRGWDVQGGANGTTAANETYISVCYLAGPGQPFTDAAKQAFKSIRSEADKRGIGSENKPHSAFKATACPGDEIRAFIPTLSGGESVPSTSKPSPAQPPAQTSQAPAFPGIMRRGHKGNNVSRFQQRLKDRGWSIVVDGDFGPKTELIVKQFQKEKNLTADGIVGPITWGQFWNAPIS